MADLLDRPRPESESGKGERQGPGAGGTRRDASYHTPEVLMRAAWWWIDRWRQSAAYRDLTPEQKGMYRDLLDEVWLRDDHVIPDDDRVMGLIVGDPERWKVLRDSILCRFTRVEGGWTHDTAMEVIAQSKTRADRQKRYRDSKRNADHNAVHNGGRSPSPSPSPSLTNGMNVGTELPPLPPPPEERAERATKETIHSLQLRLGALLAALAEHENSRQMVPAWCREVTSYDKADGTKVRGVADFRTIQSIDRLERSIGDAEWHLAELDKGVKRGA